MSGRLKPGRIWQYVEMQAGPGVNPRPGLASAAHYLALVLFVPAEDPFFRPATLHR